MGCRDGEEEFELRVLGFGFRVSEIGGSNRCGRDCNCTVGDSGTGFQVSGSKRLYGESPVRVDNAVGHRRINPRIRTRLVNPRRVQSIRRERTPFFL